MWRSRGALYPVRPELVEGRFDRLTANGFGDEDEG